MKVKAGQIDGFVAAPPAGVRAFLLFGPDTGMVAAHAKTLAKQIVPDDGADPFNRVRLAPEDLKEERARIADELTSTTLMGGQRVISCIGFGEREWDVVESALDLSAGSNNRLIVTAGDLKPASKLRKLFETQDDTAAIACYADESRSLTQVIRETLGTACMEADRDALALLSSSLGADRSLSLRELEKLILYKGEPGTITADDVAAIIADAAPLAIDTYLYALTDGDLATADSSLQRLLDDGQAPIRLHNALTQHLSRFAEILGTQGDPASAAQRLRPPLFWKVRDTFVRQAGRMREARLITALKSAHNCGVDLRVSALPPDLLLSRLTLRLCHIFK